MLFQPKVQESVAFDVFLFCLISQESYIFPDTSAVSSLFSLLKKDSCKIREMKLQNVSNGGNFLFYKRF